MVKQLSPKTAIVNIKELGTNCWRPCRFIRDDGRCERVYTCSYPEKKTCEAINAEILHLVKIQTQLVSNYVKIGGTIHILTEMLKK